MYAELEKGLLFPDEDHEDDVETGDFKQELLKKFSIAARKIFDRPDSPPECARSDTPSSYSSTSGIFSMGSYDDDVSHESSQDDKTSEDDETSNDDETEEEEYVEPETDDDEDDESVVIEHEVAETVAEDVQSAEEHVQSGAAGIIGQERAGGKRKQEVEIYYDPVINYGGRNILDLGSHLRDPAPFCTFTALPQFTIRNCWENRSIYHRLGPYGTLNEFGYEKCTSCDFYTPYQLETRLFD